MAIKRPRTATSRATTDETSLLAAIAAAPDESGPRVVYADWLLDRGNRWGEYIHMALAYAAGDESVLARMNTLERTHAKAWLAPVRPFITSWRFDRGLISSVTCSAKFLARAGAAIAARAPRATLMIFGLRRQDMPALVTAPLGAFATVNIDSRLLDDKRIGQLFASPSIAGVETWQLRHNSFTDVGVRVIAGSSHVGSVRELDLSAENAPITADTLAELLRSKRLRGLRALSIAALSVENAFASCALELDSLALYTDRFTNRDAIALASTKSFGRLTSLRICQIGWRAHALELDATGAKILVSKLPKLARLVTPPLTPALEKVLKARPQGLRLSRR